MTDSTLDGLLAQWAAHYRLSDAQAASIRHTVVLSGGAASADEPDPEWLWNLMRPVTRLLDGPHPLFDTLMRGYA